MTLDSHVTYQYRPRWTTLLFSTLFFGAAGVILGAKALENDHGLLINGIIELSPSSATGFYWVLCGLSALFVVAALALTGLSIARKQSIRLGPDSITLPTSRWSAKHITIRLVDLQAIDVRQVSGQQFAYLYHPGGKATIVASMLPKKADLEAIVHTLAKYVNESLVSRPSLEEGCLTPTKPENGDAQWQGRNVLGG